MDPANPKTSPPFVAFANFVESSFQNSCNSKVTNKYFRACPAVRIPGELGLEVRNGLL